VVTEETFRYASVALDRLEVTGATVARPRSDEARRKALDAARELILNKGVVNLTIEDVAAVSGVAKTTIYRHWPERTALIVDTVNAMFEHLRTPDTGSLRGDLEAFFGAVMRNDLSGNVGQIMPAIIEAADRDPEMAYLLERVGSERERVCRTIIERALERGEIRPEVAAVGMEVLIGVTVGPIVFQKIVRRRKLTPEYVDGCLDIVIAGLTER
jgi:AcrR family transcriptional regulator